MNISAPIMSRFDLFYVVLDEGDELVDYNIARHIINIHKVMNEWMNDWMIEWLNDWMMC